MSADPDTAPEPALSLDGPVERRRMLLIINPHATTVTPELRGLVVRTLSVRYDVTAIDTEAQGHAIDLCREAASEGYDVVVAFGGDGTVNEVANGLAEVLGTSAGSAGPVLTCLPGGATNVWCRILGIPDDVVEATGNLLRLADSWDPRSIDLARVNGRYFTFSSGVGLDASVVERVDRNPRMKARLGAWFFTFVAVATFVQRYLVRPPRMTVSAGGHAVEGVTVLVQNADPYTYFRRRPVHAADGGELDDGVMSCVVLRRSTPTVVPTIVMRLLSSRARLSHHRAVVGYSGVEEIVVRSANGRLLPLEVDGDYVGDVEEAHYEIAPGAISVVA